MKKLLLAAAVATFATSALASENMFYVRADAGASFTVAEQFNVKMKRSNHVVAGLGVGTYLMDKVRAEINFANHFNADQKGKGEDAGFKIKYEAMSVNVNALVDVVDMGYGSVFLGGGLGMTRLSAKYHSPAIPAQDGAAAIDARTVKAKAKNNVSFRGIAGVSMEAADGVRFDVTYSYNDHGKTNAVAGEKAHFVSHDVTAGFRVEL